jgi:hypothetical protein
MDTTGVAEVRFVLKSWDRSHGDPVSELAYVVRSGPEDWKFSDLFLLARDALSRAYEQQLAIERAADDEDG